MTVPSAAPTVAVGAPAAPSRVWFGVTTVLTWAIFFQAVTAGSILSGDDWARSAHRTTASLVFLAALGAGIAAAARLRGVPGGRRLAVMLLGLSVALFVQDGLGKAAADGRDTLWLHVPLGVAVVGLAAQASMGARRLGPVTA